MRPISVQLRGGNDTRFDKTDEMNWFASETREFNSHKPVASLMDPNT